MDKETIKKIEDYVYKNYKDYVGKQLIINENKSCFHVLKHKDGSPLILGKGILN